MRKNLIFLFVLCLFGFSKAQKGKQFPAIDGKYLDNKKAVVPLKNGKETLIAIAFHRKAEDELKKWLNPLYYTFIKKAKGESSWDMAEVYDVNFVFIPMISGFKKLAEDFKKGTDKEFWGYIMDTEKTDIKSVQKELEIKNNKIPYFFILDKNGKVVTVQSGDFDEKKIEKLEESLGE
jgi:hypothetical protein